MSQRLLFLPFVMLFIASTKLWAGTGEVHFPTPSTWTLDLQTSQLPGPAAMKSVVLTVSADNPDLLTFSETTVLIDGKILKAGYSYPEDGKMHPFSGGSGMKRAVWPDGHFQQKTSSGAKLDGQWTIAEDQLTATLTGRIKLPNGKEVDIHYIYRRVNQ